MPSVGYDLWFLDRLQQFAESLPGGAEAILLPPETVILKAVYIAETAIADLEAARRLFNTPNVCLLRPVPSSDGPPFRSVLVYVSSGGSDLTRVLDSRTPGAFVANVSASYYQAVLSGAQPWTAAFNAGRPGFFLTGTGSAELWRLARLEQDALDRQVLTLAPVRLPHGLAVPNFDSVSSPQRAYLVEKFEAFRKAVASGAHFEIIDRAANIAEAVLAHTLMQVGRSLPDTLARRLSDAKAVLEDHELRRRFALTDYGYHLAHKIRLLHSFIHEDQAAKRGGTVRTEVGMGLASDVSELLVEVGLARY